MLLNKADAIMTHKNNEAVWVQKRSGKIEKLTCGFREGLFCLLKDGFVREELEDEFSDYNVSYRYWDTEPSVYEANHIKWTDQNIQKPLNVNEIQEGKTVFVEVRYIPGIEAFTIIGISRKNNVVVYHDFGYDPLNVYGVNFRYWNRYPTTEDLVMSPWVN